MPDELKKFNELVQRWEDNEIFYRKLYKKKQQSEKEYHEFLAGLDEKELKQKGLCVPDLFSPYTSLDEVHPIFSIDSDIAVWKHSRYTPPFEHMHSYFEVICVISGKVLNRIEHTKDLEMQAGDICILPDRTVHSLETSEDDTIVLNVMLRKSTFRHTFFDILSSDDMLSHFFQDALYGETHLSYLYFKTGNDERIGRCLRQMFMEYYFHRKYYDKVLRSLVICLFSYLVRDYEKYFVVGNNRMELEIFKYLKKNFMDVTLESAARHFNYSTAYFSRMIRRMTGQTFTQLMQKYRMDMACRLLRESRLHIGQISEIAGYKNPEHFNRQFRKKFNKSPSEYRKYSRGDAE